jgi:hypothetical protein
VNGAIVLDIDLSSGLSLDAFDVLAARSDEFADAIRRDCARLHQEPRRARICPID